MGSPQKQAFTAVFDEANSKGGISGRQIQYFFEVDQSNPFTAVIAATKLIRDKKAAIMTGPSITDSGMSMIPVCEQQGVLFFITAPVFALYKKWVFFLGPGDQRVAAHTAQAIAGHFVGILPVRVAERQFLGMDILSPAISQLHSSAMFPSLRKSGAPRPLAPAKGEE
jgi:ABC-type branched-subunit amino acid transport system substrate-binding protein